MEGASNVCAEVRGFLQENPGSKMARRPFLKRFPGFRSRSIAGVRLRSPSGNGYAAPPIPAALGDAKVLLVYHFTLWLNSTGSAYASPPFRGSLTVIAGERAAPFDRLRERLFHRQRFAPLHGGVGCLGKAKLPNKI